MSLKSFVFHCILHIDVALAFINITFGITVIYTRIQDEPHVSRLPKNESIFGAQGAFTCVRWQVKLCDPIWHVTPRSSEAEFQCTFNHF